MVGRDDCNFSFSGLKTALRLEAEKIAPLSDQDVADLCASFQEAVRHVVAAKTEAAFKDEYKKVFSNCGGCHRDYRKKE